MNLSLQTPHLFFFVSVLAAAGAGQIGVLALTQPLGTKAVHYNTYIEKTQGHLKRVGNEQDRIRYDPKRAF